MAVFLAVTRSARGPGEEPAFLSAVLSNGALFPAAALAIVLPLFLPVSVAVVAGDAVAGEASSGTLRYLLIRPVGPDPAAGGQAGLAGRLRAVRGRRCGHAYLIGIMLFDGASRRAVDVGRPG